jgi:hypothetical protein
MELEGPSCSQELTIGPYSEPDESSLHFPILLLYT